MAKTFAPLTEVAQAIYDLMVAEGRPLTLVEVRELGIENANSAHFTALRNRNLIVADDIEKEVVTVAKRTVKLYSLPASDDSDASDD